MECTESAEEPLFSWTTAWDVAGALAFSPHHGLHIATADPGAPLLSLPPNANPAQAAATHAPSSSRASSALSGPPLAVHADPHAPHSIILVCEGGDNLYVHRGKARLMGKARNLPITAVAWMRCDPSRGAETREVLLGTATGAIYEASIEPSRTRLLRQLLALPKPEPVHAICLEPFGTGGGGGAAEERSLFVMAATASRCYEFVGPPSLESLLAREPSSLIYSSAPPAKATTPPLGRTSLALARRADGTPSAYAWLTAGGVQTGSLLLRAGGSRESIMYDVQQLVPPSCNGSIALDVALTDFHLLVLYADCVVALSRLGQEQTARLPMPGLAPLRGMACEAGSIYAWSADGVFALSSSRENRHMWRLHLAAGDFDAALSHCSATEPAQRDTVLIEQAEHELARGAYATAARHFARTSRPLEEVALRFIASGCREALQLYLLHKIDEIDESCSSQLTMVCTWLLELYVQSLAELPKAEADAASAAKLRPFLADRLRHLHRGVATSILEASGRSEDVAYFAALCSDWERLISLHLQRKEYGLALEQLGSLVDDALARGSGSGAGTTSTGAAELEADVERLIVLSGTELLLHEPGATVDVWMRASFVDPIKLLPSLERYDAQHSATVASAVSSVHHGLRYLEHCASSLGNKQHVLHSYLVQLHARHSSDSVLSDYISGYAVYYDRTYALLECLKRGRIHACIQLYQLAGNLPEAVALALQHGDLPLAKASANLAGSDERLRKRLWVSISNAILADATPTQRRSTAGVASDTWIDDGGGDDDDTGRSGGLKRGDAAERISAAVQLLSECPLLSIEDLLPLCPDSTRLDTLKAHVVAAIDGHTRRLDQLKLEMDAATSGAEATRARTHERRMRPPPAPARDTCDCADLFATGVCGGASICGHRCAVFPCRHAFRIVCLAAALGADERAQAPAGSRGPLEERLVAECPLCGDAMVRSVCVPILDPIKDAAQLESWAVYS